MDERPREAVETVSELWFFPVSFLSAVFTSERMNGGMYSKAVTGRAPCPI